VIVVSHVSPIKSGVTWALGTGPETTWRMQLDRASICRIAIGPRGPGLVGFNETSHL
jgi:broad specificity phosphatase PhoE